MTAALQDVGAWALNVTVSVLIVFVNKRLMADHGFHYAHVLTGVHFLVTWLIMWVVRALGYIERRTVPWKDLALFILFADLSIGSLNASLMLNPVCFYQICKVLITPCTCLVDFCWKGTTISRPRLAAIAVVLAGVLVVTGEVGQVEAGLGGVAPLGAAVAAVSVASSALQMLHVGHLQEKLQLTSHELLAVTAPAQALSLLALGPLADQHISSGWVLDYEWAPTPAAYLAASCFLAVVVNGSQYLCIGRFSAVSFQVMGHAKTVLVLLVGLVALHEPLGPRKAAGMAAAVGGMALYSALPNAKALPKAKAS